MAEAENASGGVVLGTGRKQVNCRFWGSKGGCHAGDACPFFHDPSLSSDGSGGQSASHETLRDQQKAKTKSGPQASSASVITGGQSAAQNPSRDGQMPKAKSGPEATSASGSKATARTGPEANPTSGPKAKARTGPEVGPASGVTAAREVPRRHVPLVDRSKIVPKPVSRTLADDPREFQIQQLRRRFSPKETQKVDGTVFEFRMAPSDPDFPFEMVGLECVLHVPKTYPADGKPWLDIKNKEMGRGFQINVEKGFDALVEKSPQLTLLGLMNALDKQLESLLTEQKAETIKIIPNAGPSSGRKTMQVNPMPKETSGSKPLTTIKPPAFTPEQKSAAALRRETETRQLEARLGRLPLFRKSSDGLSYILPIEPRKRAELPEYLRVVETIKLFVPLLYPLEPCTIELQDIAKATAISTEKAFEKKARESSGTTLMAHINYLTQNMHLLVAEPVQEKMLNPREQELRDYLKRKGLLATAEVESKAKSEKELPKQADAPYDRSHVYVVPRPPEWTVIGADGEEEEDLSDSYDSGDEFSEEDTGVELDPVQDESSRAVPERGVLLSFPYMELHGIELLEVTSLCITVKCERCKDQMDIKNLRTSIEGSTTARSESCKKCASSLRIGYRRELMHVNSVRAGYLDLDGCTVVDMLPSNFVPTCSECSTPYPPPGLVSVRGESTMATCRECHHKMSFKIPEVKFLLVSSAGIVRHDRPPPRKKVRENLGIVAGQELPRRGRCTHYSKSYRWFRFGCCAKVFPCDRCHDEASDHPNEHANRMICGFCSREQNYRPEDCGICHAVLIGKAGSGFWEGGKGTRDKTKMNRKDPRKYKRRPGGTLKKT